MSAPYTSPNRSRLNRYAGEALESERGRASEYGGQATESRGQFLSALGGFDPTEYAGRTAGAFTSQAIEDLDSADAESRKYANRTGVLHGASRQANRLDFRKRMSRELAGLGMQAGGMELSRIGQMGNVYGMDVGREESARGGYLDFLSGERDRTTAEENARRMEQAQRDSRPRWWESVLGAAGQLGGSYLGAR